LTQSKVEEKVRKSKRKTKSISISLKKGANINEIFPFKHKKKSPKLTKSRKNASG